MVRSLCFVAVALFAVTIGYAQGVAYSESGSIKGPWVQEKEALFG